MTNPIDDDWRHVNFDCIDHLALIAIAAELGVDVLKVRHASGVIEGEIGQGRCQPVRFDRAEFVGLVCKYLNLKAEAPQAMAPVDDEESGIPF